MLARQPAAIVLADEGAIGDAQQRVMRLIHVGAAEMHVIGRHQRQLQAIGQVQQSVLGGAFFRQAMTLEFDIQAIEESRRECLQCLFGRRRLAIQQKLVHRPARPAGQQDQALGMRQQPLGLHMRPVAGFHLQIGRGQQPGEIEIAGLILHQQRHMRRLLAAAGL